MQSSINGCNKGFIFDKAKNLTDVIFMRQKFDSTKTKAEQLGWRRANLKQYESCGDR